MSSGFMQIYVWFYFAIQIVIMFYFYTSVLQTRYNKLVTFIIYMSSVIGFRLFTNFLVDNYNINQGFIFIINLLWYGTLGVLLFRGKNIVQVIVIVDGALIFVEIVATIIMLIMTAIFGINIIADKNLSDYNFEYLVATPIITMAWFPFLDAIQYIIVKEKRSAYKSKILTVFYIYQLILTFVLFLNFFNNEEHIAIVATLTVTFAIIINVVVIALINVHDDSQKMSLKHEEANKLKEEEVIFYQQTCVQIEEFRKSRHDCLNNLNVIKNMSKNGASKEDINNMIESVIDYE